MGPAEEDDMPSMHVWIFQRTEGGTAVASGDSREPQPANRPGPRRWRVVTGLDPDSQEFSPGRPAVAMAMAIVRRKDGSLDVEHWSQAVIVTDEGDTRDDGSP
jgi:hypothetical protein